MAGSTPNLHTIYSRSACIQVCSSLKVKVKVKGHVIRALSWILGMSYSLIDGLVCVTVHFPVDMIFSPFIIRGLTVTDTSIFAVCCHHDMSIVAAILSSHGVMTRQDLVNGCHQRPWPKGADHHMPEKEEVVSKSAYVMLYPNTLTHKHVVTIPYSSHSILFCRHPMHCLLSHGNLFSCKYNL